MNPLPLVCLHGWGLNRQVFKGLGERWPGPLRALDLPGHGGAPLADTATLEAWADALLPQLPARCALLGWSLGGQLALQLAQRAPAQVERLVLVATTPRFVAAPDWIHGMTPAALQRFAAGLNRDWQGTVDEFLQLQVRGSRDADQALRQLQQALLGCGAADPQALAAGLQILHDSDLRPSATGVTAPALVISGQHDRVTQPAAAAWLAAALPQARHVQMPRAGHAPFLSHPDDFVGHLADFMAEAA